MLACDLSWHGQHVAMLECHCSWQEQHFGVLICDSCCCAHCIGCFTWWTINYECRGSNVFCISLGCSAQCSVRFMCCDYQTWMSWFHCGLHLRGCSFHVLRLSNMIIVPCKREKTLQRRINPVAVGGALWKTNMGLKHHLNLTTCQISHLYISPHHNKGWRAQTPQFGHSTGWSPCARSRGKFYLWPIFFVCFWNFWRRLARLFL